MDLSNQLLKYNIDKDFIIKLGMLCILDKSNSVLNRLEEIMKSYESKQILINIEALNRGIIPFKETSKIHECLNSVPYEEGLKLKRKFRKLQRKYRKQNSKKDLKCYGSWNEDPDFLQKHKRKNLVFDAIEKELDD
jgi:hypothetical protein